MDTLTIATVIVLVIVAALLVWLSWLMALGESAVSRVTKAILNNRIIKIQTEDQELGKLVQTRQIRKVHKVQKLIVDRYATAGSCAFFRIFCNVFDGVLVSVVVMLVHQPLWVAVTVGAVFALMVAVVSILLRPSSAGTSQPLALMMRYSSIISLAVKLTPFAKSRENKEQRRHDKENELSDDEALEKIQREQGRATIDRLVETDDFDPEVAEMMRNVLMLSDTLTREIMVPRTDMICVESDVSLQDFLQMCSRSGFSRIPIIGDDVDDLVGMAYLKDAVRATAFNLEAREREIKSISRVPMLVPESKPVDDLFHEMQRTRQHVAVVVDEYGGIAGLVTIEDAIEQIVGELDDEHDRIQHAEPVKIGPNKWQMPARTSIADLEELFEVDIDEDDVDTVYGLLTKLLGRVPIVGMSAVTRGLRLTAVDSAGRRKKVSTIVVEPVPLEDSDDDSGETGEGVKQNKKENEQDD